MVVYALLGIFASVLFSNIAVSSWTAEAGETPYQATHSDRIITGTVKSMSSSFDSTDVIIGVDEWLKNPLPADEITVRTEHGTNAFTVGAAEFSVGEKVLLMLKDEDIEEGRLRMLNMELGKHNISERDAVIKGILSGTTKHIARPPDGIQTLDPEIADPAIAKENASSIAARIIPISIENARIALTKDAHRYKTYWEFTYMENAEKQSILEIDTTTGEALAYFSYNKPGNQDECFEKSKGMRFMGQKFIPDSYMFQNLVFLEYTGNSTPFTMVISEWNQNLYWSWLCTLRGITEMHKSYPAGG